jgi:hypothetical protein
MAKETFYFSHDYNARSDEKIKRLIRKHGLLGYGVFWSIIEDLYNNANALLLDYEGISFELRVDENIVKSILNDFDLFVFDGNYFGSLSVQKRIDERNERSKRASETANKRWNKMKTHCESDANALQEICEGNAIKERKGKEINKIKENIDYAFDSDVFKKCFDDWIKYRKEKKKPLTKRTMEMQSEMLKKYPESTAIQIINKSIMNGWSGLFEPKGITQSPNLPTNKVQESGMYEVPIDFDYQNLNK